MKNPGFLVIILALFMMSSCADKPSRPDSILSDAQKTAADAAATAAAAGGIQAAPAGVAGLPHYYCANSCEGSGGDSQGNCPVCGTTYTHNDAFHNQPPAGAPATGGAPTTTITPPIIGGPDGQTITSPISPTGTPPPPSPAQNANGVFHYTCPAGCAGGAGGAGSCTGCGGALAHNQEYHN